MYLQLDVEALLNGEIRSVSKYGSSRNQRWECEDKYIVGYSTEKITGSVGGKYDGKFACIVWKPVKSKGKIIKWEIKYFRAFRQRKKAREYAEKFYYQHSPKQAIKHEYGHHLVKSCGCPKNAPEIHQEGCAKAQI